MTAFPSLAARVRTRERKNRMGEPKLGSTVPLLTPGLFAEYKGRIVRVRNHGRSIFLPICSFPSAAGGALCRRSRVGAAVAAEQSGQ
jgi:hypothetical protein